VGGEAELLIPALGVHHRVRHRGDDCDHHQAPDDQPDDESPGPAPAPRGHQDLVSATRRGLPVLGLPVLGLPVLRLPVLGLAVLGLAVLGLAVLGLAVLGLPVLGLPVLGLAVLRCGGSRLRVSRRGLRAGRRFRLRRTPRCVVTGELRFAAVPGSR
jgi:hypothetical protein